MPSAPRDQSATRWRILALLGVAEVFGMSPWFGASAVVGELQARWALDASGAAALTSAVQIGFVVGTALVALLNVADLVAARTLFAASGALAAAANAALLLAPGHASALLLRALTGFFLAGVYPPAMKMVATWFRDGRGLAIGALVGSLTVGKATPYLVRAAGGGDLATVCAATSLAALVGAAAVGIGYRDGPYAFPKRPFDWGLVGLVLRDRPTRLATAGYLGHMWELYAMWTWLPAFLAASARASGAGLATDLVAFLAIGVGAAGAIGGGALADRIGRERLAAGAMVGSAGCCLAAALVYGGPSVAVVGLALAWGVLVIADSAQFSALVTEVCPPHAVGTALALQTSLGFLLTTATIQLVPLVADAFTWRWAFPLLAAGPALGVVAMRRLARLRASA